MFVLNILQSSRFHRWAAELASSAVLERLLTLAVLHRKNYEESMMVRLSMPKHQKNAKKRNMMSMSGQLSGITHFSDITALTGGEGGQVSSHSAQTRRDTFGKFPVQDSRFKISILSLCKHNEILHDTWQAQT